MTHGREITGEDLLREGRYALNLSSCGNVDHDQDPDRQMYGVRPDIAYVSNLAEAARAARAYIDTNGLGGGNWARGEVRDADDNLVANISYNGRVWAASDAQAAAHRERQR